MIQNTAQNWFWNEESSGLRLKPTNLNEPILVRLDGQIFTQNYVRSFLMATKIFWIHLV